MLEWIRPYAPSVPSSGRLGEPPAVNGEDLDSTPPIPAWQRWLQNALAFIVLLLAGLGIMFVMMFFRFRVIHKERFFDAPNTVLVMNHRTLVDSFVKIYGLYWPWFVRELFLHGRNRLPFHTAKRRNFFNTPGKVRFFSLCHVIPVFGDNDQTLTSRATRILDTHALSLFPEGTRNKEFRTCKLLRFRPGIGLLAHKTGLTAIPMWAEGTENLQPPQVKGHRTFSLKLKIFRRITIVVGEPISFAHLKGRPFTKADCQAVADQLHAAVLALESEAH